MPIAPQDGREELHGDVMSHPITLPVDVSAARAGGAGHNRDGVDGMDTSADGDADDYPLSSSVPSGSEPTRSSRLAWAPPPARAPPPALRGASGTQTCRAASLTRVPALRNAGSRARQSLHARRACGISSL